MGDDIEETSHHQKLAEPHLLHLPQLLLPLKNDFLAFGPKEYWTSGCQVLPKKILVKHIWASFSCPPPNKMVGGFFLGSLKKNKYHPKKKRRPQAHSQHAARARCGAWPRRRGRWRSLGPQQGSHEVGSHQGLWMAPKSS